jgi:hypothetical protein
MAIQHKQAGIRAHHVLKAAQKWREQNGYGGFRPSRHYDVIIEGEHFPPKAIVAIANELSGGPKMRQADFPGAWDGKWHRELKRLGFVIVPKGLVPADPEEAGPLALAAEDIREVLADHPGDATVRETLVMARLGQGKYRKELLALWGGSCAVTGCSVTQAIRASHAKPWRDSSDEERLNPNNGLPLVANLDALFDAGFITFDSDGMMLVSPALDEETGLLENVSRRLRLRPTKEQAEFLYFHAEEVFEHYSTDNLMF